MFSECTILLDSAFRPLALNLCLCDKHIKCFIETILISHRFAVLAIKRLIKNLFKNRERRRCSIVVILKCSKCLDYGSQFIINFVELHSLGIDCPFLYLLFCIEPEVRIDRYSNSSLKAGIGDVYRDTDSMFTISQCMRGKVKLKCHNAVVLVNTEVWI